ncbi:MdtA/MuxA family multidrug efflux RND transporter periplasmic adaptor subunit [Methylocapsa polymorpha]|uniref:MdtA/MuxA family multidrug efflux RND transporter periplasmic adaptor subunit n=1 Tax=Methylocapsa polymorpha TaxID=3080828 RepID=A0ABZ0HPV8_9HYPH|nr:MdtA/MuxA family multidrug efflux RND transporter periplasmic adaptor subunit [Methylocapsa sp. RX1]
MDDRTRTAENEIAEKFFLRDEKPSFREEKIARPDVRTKRGRRLGPIFLLGLAILIGLGVYRIVATVRAPKESGRGQQQTAPQPVGAATIALGDIKVVVDALGTVTPLATVTVKTQVNGQLTEVAFKEGQTVKKGDFLAQIDPRPFQIAETQFQGQLIHDQGLLDQAKMDHARYETLVKQNSIARQQAEDQAYLVKQYEGSVKTDQAQIDTQRLNLIYAHIVSPIDGRVGLRLVDAGNYVQTTDAGIAVLTQLHPISVIFTVPEDDLPDIMAQMRAGTPLEVTAYDRANVTRLAVGKVITLDNQIDTTTGTVKLRAEFQNQDDKLFPNQFVNARLLINTLHNVVTAPTASIQRGAPGAFVYLIGADDTVSVRTVEVGPTDGGMVAVTSGLAPGDRVVVDGADRLRDGAQVFIPSGDNGAGGGHQGKAAGPEAPASGEPSRRGNRQRQQGGQ